MLLKIAVLLSAACSCAIAIKGEDTVEIDTGNYYDIVDFGFLKGGTFDVTVKISNSDLNGSPQRIFVFGLYDSGMNYLPDDSDDLCKGNVTNLWFADWAALLTPNTSVVTAQGNVSKDALYYVVGVTCEGDVSVEVKYHFVNPHGEELSSTQIPYKTATLVFCVAWGLLVLAWLVNRYGHTHLANSLHAAFGAISALCLVTAFGVNRFYVNYSKTGTINKPLLFGCVFLDALTFSILSLVCMLMASGYCLSRMNVSTIESRSITVLAVFFGMAKFGFDVVSGLAFAFLLLAAYALVMYWIMKHSKMNIEILYMRLAMAMEAAHDGMFGRLANQFSITRRFRTATLTFICLAVMLDIWGTLGLRRVPWAVYSMGEILQFTLIGYLLYLLRLSRGNVYLATVESNMALLPQDGLHPISEATAAASPDSHSVSIIVVSNPGSLDESGHATRDLMVATPAVAPLTDSAVLPTAPQQSDLVEIHLEDQEENSDSARLLPRSS